jgi:hypothetical protein
VPLRHLRNCRPAPQNGNHPALYVAPSSGMHTVILPDATPSNSHHTSTVIEATPSIRCIMAHCRMFECQHAAVEETATGARDANVAAPCGHWAANAGGMDGLALHEYETLSVC